MKYNKNILEDKQKIIFLEEKKGFLFLDFEDTIFYPGGGGQPNDIGIIENKDFKGEVVEVFKEKDRILHKVKVLSGNLGLGDKAELKINKENREKIVRMHTGEHIFYKSLEKSIPTLKLKKINLGLDESSLFVESEKITWEDIFKAEDLANSIIEKDLPIIEHHMTKEEALKSEKLRIKEDRINSNKIRVIEVKDFDFSACMGCHAASTGFVEDILVTNFHQAKEGYEIRFKTNAKKDIFEMAKTARKTAFNLDTRQEQVLEKIKKLIKEAEEYKEKFREISAALLNNYKTEKIKEVDFIYSVVEHVEKKQLIDKSNELLREKTIVCFISKQGNRALIIINSSQELKLNMPEILNKILLNFNARGGGKDNFAMASIDLDKSDDFLDLFNKELKNFIFKK